MTNTAETKPYCVQPELSPNAKKALHDEQARLTLAGKKVRIRDIAADIIEKWAANAA